MVDTVTDTTSCGTADSAVSEIVQKCAISDLMVSHVTHYLHSDWPQVT